MQGWEADFCHDFAISCVADLFLQKLMAASRCIVWAELRRNKHSGFWGTGITRVNSKVHRS